MALDPKLVDRALSEATKRAENLDFFFDNLKSSDWIEPLRAKGLFSEPPRQYVDDERLVRAPSWSASRYLARVSAVAPQLVLEVIESTETNNERVLEDFIDAAVVMPPEEASRIAVLVAAWVSERDNVYYGLPSKIVDLVVKLARDGQPEVGIRLMRSLFAPQPDEREQVLRSSPRARFSGWEYDTRLRKIVSEALPIAPSLFLDALAELLADALKYLREISDRDNDDLSRVWRVHIRNDRDRGTEVEEALTSAVRDAATEIRTRELMNDFDLVALLTARPEELFRRIAMYALSQEPMADLDVVLPFVVDVSELIEAEPSPEFRELLRATAERLDSDHIEHLVTAIFAGPDVDQYRELAKHFDGVWPTDEQTSAHVARWRIGRLALIKDALPAETRSTYDALVAEYGEADIPLSWEIRTFSGPNSPISADELSAMSNDELICYLRDWKQPEGFGEPSVEGLARAMSVVAERDPMRISRLAPRLRDLRPAYVQWILNGFEGAIREQRSFDLPTLLDILTWIAEQPREIPGGRGDEYSDIDPGWVWARREIAGLLERGLSDRGACAIPFSERERVWNVITAVSEDPDPTPEHEQQYGGQNMDPATLALNTARPRGLRAAVAYSIWVYHALLGEDERSIGGFFAAHAPEAAVLLEAHLDPQGDPSTSVRAVYGQFFANLFAVDRAWAKKVAETVFPDEDSALREAAWGAYVIYTRPYDDLLALLCPAYLRAAQHARSDGHGFRWMNGIPSEKLGEHVAAFFWRGLLNIDDPLISVYWNNASADARGHMIEFFGRSLREAEQLDPEIEKRLREFWEFAKRNVRKGDVPTELGSFCWWFVGDTLPLDWRFEQMIIVLSEKVQPRAAFLVAEKLPSVAQQHPLLAVRVLRLLLQDAEVWSVDAWRKEIESVLRIAYSANGEARDLAEETLNWLLALGHRSFRNVVEA